MITQALMSDERFGRRWLLLVDRDVAGSSSGRMLPGVELRKMLLRWGEYLRRLQLRLWEVAMARWKATDDQFARMMAAVIAEARATKKLPELLAVTMAKLRKKDPQAAETALRMMIETMAELMPEPKREQFLNELMAFLKPN
jgi:hypothetical protein